MTIETKYSLGDEVWYMENNEAKKSRVEYIYTNTHTSIQHGVPPTTNISASYHLTGRNVIISEDDLFSTKEELLKSL